MSEPVAVRDPEAIVYLREQPGGFMVYETDQAVIDKIAMSSPGEFLHLTGIHFEGHEFKLHIRASEVGSVISLSPERYAFEMQRFMASREAEETDIEMRRATASAMSAASEDEED